MHGSWAKIRTLTLILPGSWGGAAPDRGGQVVAGRASWDILKPV
jgi:hypothetical protein